MRLSNELSFYLYRLKLNFSNKQALRLSFLLQIISIIMGNSAFFIIWIVFSKAIGPVNGWGVLQTFGMISITIFTFGVCHTLFGTLGKLNEVVPSGAFDAYLTKPKSLYIRIINNEFLVSAIGDLLQGFIGIVIFLWLLKPDWQSVLLFILMLPPAFIIELSIIMLYDCVIFWLPQAPNLSNALFNFILLPATQPISLLKGGIRFLYLYIIPALVIAGLPVEAISQYNWYHLPLAYTIAITWFLISRWVLMISIRRYESGNSIG